MFYFTYQSEKSLTSPIAFYCDREKFNEDYIYNQFFTDLKTLSLIKNYKEMIFYEEHLSEASFFATKEDAKYFLDVYINKNIKKENLKKFKLKELNHKKQKIYLIEKKTLKIVTISLSVDLVDSILENKPYTLIRDDFLPSFYLNKKEAEMFVVKKVINLINSIDIESFQLLFSIELKPLDEESLSYLNKKQKQIYKKFLLKSLELS